jgi:hypothetical protein
VTGALGIIPEDSQAAFALAEPVTGLMTGIESELVLVNANQRMTAGTGDFAARARRRLSLSGSGYELQQLANLAFRRHLRSTPAHVLGSSEPDEPAAGHDRVRGGITGDRVSIRRFHWPPSLANEAAAVAGARLTTAGRPWNALGYHKSIGEVKPGQGRQERELLSNFRIFAKTPCEAGADLVQ